MKIFFETVAVAFSMFSALPMPQFPWNEDNMRYALCAFPLIGAVVGFAAWGADALCRFLSAPDLLRGVVLTLLPVLLTGGIHLDGFADTWDALGSHADPARRQEILSDPHVGSFAVIHLCMYFLLTAALWTSLTDFPPAEVTLSFILSRTLSGLAVASFPLAKDTGLAKTFRSAADQGKVRRVLLVLDLLVTLALCACGPAGICMAGAAQVFFAVYYRVGKRSFGGISGDLAGWFLTGAEMGMLFVLVAVELVEKVG